VPARGRLKRLDRIEERIEPETCPACRDRRGLTVLAAFREEDGVVVPDGPRPEPCSSCGEVPEMVVEVVERVVTAAR
jgi:hypothetical protein